jgi:hypothetical protein
MSVGYPRLQHDLILYSEKDRRGSPETSVRLSIRLHSIVPNETVIFTVTTISTLSATGMQISWIEYI